MRKAKQTALAVTAVLLAHAWLLPSVGSAGPIYEWWMARRAARTQPPVVLSQSPVVAAQSCCDVSACGACETACSTCDTGCNSCGTTNVQPTLAQRTVVNYAPQTAYTSYTPTTAYSATTAYSPTIAYAPAAAAPRWGGFFGLFRRYRTTWARVPVTSYRPTVSVDPTTGASVTVLQPCTTYTWQLARVPVTALRPTTLAAAYGVPAVAATTRGFAATTVSQPVVSSGCSSCATGAAISSSPSSTPIYSAPASAAPSIPSATVTPSTASPPAVTVPAGPAGTVGPAETAPADQPPRLDRDQINQGASFRIPSVVKPVAPRRVPRDETTATTKTSQGKFEIGAGIKPVPDPDAPARRDAGAPQETGDKDDADAIELNNPRDRTAMAPLRRTWSYQPVSWATGETAAPVTAPAVHQQPLEDESSHNGNAADDEWDASGWKSLRS